MIPIWFRTQAPLIPLLVLRFHPWCPPDSFPPSHALLHNSQNLIAILEACGCRIQTCAYRWNLPNAERVMQVCTLLNPPRSVEETPPLFADNSRRSSSSFGFAPFQPPESQPPLYFQHDAFSIRTASSPSRNVEEAHGPPLSADNSRRSSSSCGFAPFQPPESRPHLLYFQHDASSTIPIKIDYISASAEANEKRINNRAASRRFRDRQKDENARMVEMENARMRKDIGSLTEERDSYFAELKYLRGIIYETTVPGQIPAQFPPLQHCRPAPPSSAPYQQEECDDSGRNTRRKLVPFPHQPIPFRTGHGL